MQKEWCKLLGVTVGTKVKITRSAASGEQGWDNTWPGDSRVGKVCTIDRISTDGSGSGIHMEEGNWYPYFILEPTDAVMEVKLSGSSPREVIFEDGSVKCGCCTLSKTQAKAAIKAFETLSTTFSGYNFKIVVEGSDITRKNMKAVASAIGA